MVSLASFLTDENNASWRTISRRYLGSAPIDSGQRDDEPIDWHTPLLLSTLAGLSTCLGAAIVFVLRSPLSTGTSQRAVATLGSAHMAFALSLAGSVMITVSIASILPECFTVNAQAGEQPVEQAHYVAFGSALFVERCVAWSIGCALYMLLSKCAFPEPDAVLGWDANSNDHDTEPLLGEENETGTEIGTTLGPTAASGHHRKRTNLPVWDHPTTTATDHPLPNTAPTLRLSPSSSALDSLKLSSAESFKIKNDRPATRWPTLLAPLRSCTDWMRGTDLVARSSATTEARRAWRVAMLLFLSLTVHNFPEGLAVAASSLQSPRLGLTTTIAIALHNIPEGIAIAIPCLAARPDAPWLAFALASGSGLAEPLGAAVALLVLSPRAQDDDDASTGWARVWHMKNILAFVAGIMMTVALVELFPEAKRHMKESPWPGVAGTVTGALVMLASDAYLDS